ncbi:MAG: ABC transporter ATP-binding protein [Clostridia bacterium]|nr:ABC transporter ATP-binding protein [Clostridia bacterium]
MSEAKTNRDSVLRLENITMQFGGVVAINNLSLEILPGEIVALIGPNGAGKTTAFNCITGVYEPTNGAVYFHGKPIAVNHPQGKMVRQYNGQNAEKYKDVHPVVYTPDRITHMGIARTFQNIRLFKSQTAFENVLIATHLRCKSNFLTASLRLNRAEEKAMRKKAMDLLETVGLAEEADELATSLPYGKQRRLEIARALATDPTLLLLDEPAAGMNPQETDELGEFIVDIKNRFHLTVFMIEHHMNLVMDISDRIYVLDFGRQIAEGTPEEIQKNPDVIAAYLGVEEE